MLRHIQVGSYCTESGSLFYTNGPVEDMSSPTAFWEKLLFTETAS